ncbi:hypothetical protein ACA910_019852 [Epithemia clementina (nom. ined.)]
MALNHIPKSGHESMSPLGRTSLIQFMSSNYYHGAFSNTEGNKADLSAYETAAEGSAGQQQCEQAYLQQLVVADSQWQQSAAPSDSTFFRAQQQSQHEDHHQYLKAMIKRSPDESGVSRSQKKARTNLTMDATNEKDAGPSISWVQSSDHFNRAWAPSSMAYASFDEAAPFSSAATSTSSSAIGAQAGNPFPGIDLITLRDSTVANPTFATTHCGLASSLGFSEHLRLSSELNAHRIHDRYSQNSLMGSLAAAQPYETVFFPGASAPSTGYFLPSSAVPSRVYAPSANPTLAGQLTLASSHPTSGTTQQHHPPPYFPPLRSSSASTAVPSDDQANFNHIVLRQIASTQNPSLFGGAASFPAHARTTSVGAGAPLNALEQAQAHGGPQFQSMAALARPPLPPLDEGRIAHYTTRPRFPLGIDEDPNWLSEFHCFVRSELAEVCRASHDDCKARNNSITYEQVGIRCRFCAHKTTNSRTGRSSAFPSSCRQIYQSFTMMLREHFPNCESMPQDLHDKFLILRDTPAQGATDSKRYWIYSAMRLGMTDTSDGIMITEESIEAGAQAAPFGSDSNGLWSEDGMNSMPLVYPSDETLVDRYLFALVSQCQLVHLTEAEQIGNRRSLKAGLPGIACTFCCRQRRLGLCRLFPAKRRTLPEKLGDLYDHFRRCTLTPSYIKEQLAQLREMSPESAFNDRDETKEFFDRIWERMGHGKSRGTPVSA